MTEKNRPSLKARLGRRMAAGAAFVFGAWLAVAFAASLPLLPSTPQYSDPSQIISTLNAIIQQLNGQTGYSGTSQLVTLGPICTASGSSGLTCNGQRGVITTNSLSTAAGATTFYQVDNSYIQSGVYCTLSEDQYSGTIGTNGVPLLVTNNVSAPGQMTFGIYNAGATNALSGTLRVIFNCQ